MNDDEHEKERKKLKVYPYIFALLMLLRGISENVFRTGSEIVIMMQSN